MRRAKRSVMMLIALMAITLLMGLGGCVAGVYDGGYYDGGPEWDGTVFVGGYTAAVTVTMRFALTEAATLWPQAAAGEGLRWDRAEAEGATAAVIDERQAAWNGTAWNTDQSQPIARRNL